MNFKVWEKTNHAHPQQKKVGLVKPAPNTAELKGRSGDEDGHFMMFSIIPSRKTQAPESVSSKHSIRIQWGTNGIKGSQSVLICSRSFKLFL